VSDQNGLLTFALRSTIDGTFDLELVIDGAVVAVDAEAVVFTACRSLENTFIRDAWPVVLSRCVGCHNEFGYAPSVGARFVLPFPGDDNFTARGIAAVRNVMEQNSAEGLDVDVSALDIDQRQALRVSEADETIPLILANPVLADVTGHAGGVVVSPAEQEEIARFRSFIARLQTSEDTCGVGSDNGLPDDDILNLTTSLPHREVFKRAALALTGDNTSEAVLNTIVDESSLESALDNLLATNRRVEDRLGEIWNDWLLTDARIGTVPVYLGVSFPRRSFFNPLQSEGASRANSCNDSSGDCCRVPESPENLDNNPDNDVPLRPENVRCEELRVQLLDSAGREPIELMKRIWRDGLPAETMLTGDWTVVDPALAGAYGLVAEDGRTFLDGVTQAFAPTTSDDEIERRRVRLINTTSNNITRRNPSIDAWPHQGILTTPAFLTRYPNTASNRERTRARVIMENFLGIPVMKLAAFATPELPPGQSLENLTWDTQPCVVCHTVIDPIASVLNIFPNATANLTIRRSCRIDGMRPPGFGFIALPGSGSEGEGQPRPSLEDEQDCLTVAAACGGDEPCATPFDGRGEGVVDDKGAARIKWLADRVTEHPRFAYAVVVPLYEGLIGQKLISAPDSLIDPDFDAKARAFEAQQREIEILVSAFRAGGGRFQPVVKAILLSRSFRAEAVSANLDGNTARALELLAIGQKSKLMTPEVLARRIQLLTGIEWNRVRNPNQKEQLAAGGQYNVFMGGIDSETVTVRSRDPVAIRAAVARRFGNEFACVAVPQEFAIVPPTERRLFRLIDLGETPIAADGSIDATIEARVLSQIRRLHTVLWSEEVLDEEEVAASYDLFLAAIREMQSPEDGSTTPTAFGVPCQAVTKYAATADGVRPAFPAAGTVDITIGDRVVPHRRVNQDPTFTVRAWMAVLSTIIADPRFIFE
jgi:hypothetical protein